ncbi:bifunctional 5,10-methylenetetrahydrofolate dehydrogenase/5,10-methenyltetrahydrofolate cyclohydrolase [Pseudovibrio brasiliensis]|uniref:Bifunctional protein FolD n=1 Tax=Pseudovibrio brasiliensis TaxID=1898042 RepID=A0ABX8AND2_9HYPH|nr:bifunctional 5,10-methylenetetrahydrofolate dehydrogenase/5,10-methenyltetrahydrofolate cyclohydrolase [Pseudovibrio brasiliensis]QUS56528.1 bifunctional 5,10-methylenetetrahydrofolate dehydrogenase/5,10-methenyltetrahydrofolate cyclohydrolase [Pseudovibrio brasiliensis]
MTQAQIICGKTLAAVIDEEVKEAIASLHASFGKTPKLTVVVVGDDPASAIYVNNKVKRCRKVGIESEKLALDANIFQAELTQVIRDLSADPDTHGILLQLPLPNGMNAREILHEIAPEKDVDGFHPLNFGSFMAGSQDALAPCTPQGCLRLLKTVIDDFHGKDATVIGCSNIVGKPMAELLLQQGCSVTSVHHLSHDIEGKVRAADIIVAAAGSPHLVKADWVKPGAVVIDVGINRLRDLGDGKSGIVGDVDFEAVSKVASAITPVPGGVGPLTISYLLVNTVRAFAHQIGASKIEL